jgi:hypothetical protein
MYRPGNLLVFALAIAFGLFPKLAGAARLSIFAALAVVLASATVVAAASGQITTSPQSVTCTKDKCTCVGSTAQCFTALSSEKRCKSGARCTPPPIGTADFDQKWVCECNTSKPKT